MISLYMVAVNITYPAPLLLRHVEVVEDSEGSEDDVVDGGAVVAAVAVVVLDVLRAVLQLVQDDAGGGNACSLQQTHQIDHKGAQQLF